MHESCPIASPCEFAGCLCDTRMYPTIQVNMLCQSLALMRIPSRSMQNNGVGTRVRNINRYRDTNEFESWLRWARAPQNAMQRDVHCSESKKSRSNEQTLWWKFHWIDLFMQCISHLNSHEYRRSARSNSLAHTHTLAMHEKYVDLWLCSEIFNSFSKRII